MSRAVGAINAKPLFHRAPVAAPVAGEGLTNMDARIIKQQQAPPTQFRNHHYCYHCIRDFFAIWVEQEDWPVMMRFGTFVGLLLGQCHRL